MRAEASPLHPHEPDVPPTLDSEGRCLVCRALIRERETAAQAAYARAVSDMVELVRFRGPSNIRTTSKEQASEDMADFIEKWHG